MMYVNRIFASSMQFLPKWLVKPFAKPYVAGLKTDEVLNVVKKLNSEGFSATIDILGEFVNTQSEALDVKNQYAELIRLINKKSLAITQKRYNKTYYYPISKSPFLNILYKDKLLDIVKSGEIELSDQIIKLVYLNDNEITVFFDKKTLDLKGWQIIDQYNNNINFSLKIVAKNDVFKKGTFKIPEMN